MTTLDPEVHIVAGTTAAATLRIGLGLPPEQVLIHHDLLSCGPLPAVASFDEWRAVRESYLRSLHIEFPWASFAECDRDVLTNRERLRSARIITLWLGTGLAEQLMLIWVIAALRQLGADASRCRIVQFDYDGMFEVIGVGVLNPSQLAEHPLPVTPTASDIQEATDAWEAVTAPEPDALLAFLADESHSLPFLSRALATLLYHYPDPSSGLNLWDYQLLQYTRDKGPKAAPVVGYAMAHDMAFPNWISDTYLFQRLHHLADPARRRPLLLLSGDTKQLQGTEVHLTPHGEAILAGDGRRGSARS